MLEILHRWFTEARRRHREKVLVGCLLHLNDHHLADVGLRRDQLQPDGIHELDLPPLRRPLSKTPTRRRQAAVRPSLQGCG